MSGMPPSKAYLRQTARLLLADLAPFALSPPSLPPLHFLEHRHLHLLLSLLSLLPSSRPSPPVLILLTKSDLLSSTAASGTASPSPSTTKPKSLSLTLDRARQSLAREMERRRLASASSSTLAGAGARLEGLEAIPASASSASLVQTILGAFGMGSKSTSLGSGEAAVVGLPEDEAEVFDKGEAFGFEGSFEWSKLGEMGVKVEWAVSSVKAREGTEKWWEWVEGL